MDVQMLVDERKQVRALLDPVKRRSLARPFQSGRECRMCVNAGVSFRLIGVLKLLTKESQATSTRTAASPPSLARSLQAPRPAGSPYPRGQGRQPMTAAMLVVAGERDSKRASAGIVLLVPEAGLR